jgi:hypothetical protein
MRPLGLSDVVTCSRILSDAAGCGQRRQARNESRATALESVRIRPATSARRSATSSSLTGTLPFRAHLLSGGVAAVADYWAHSRLAGRPAACQPGPSRSGRRPPVRRPGRAASGHVQARLAVPHIAAGRLAAWGSKPWLAFTLRRRTLQQPLTRNLRLVPPPCLLAIKAAAQRRRLPWNGSVTTRPPAASMAATA